MPTYNGHSITYGTIRINSAKPRETKQVVDDVDLGARVPDAYLGGKNIKVANRHIVIVTLKRSLRFDTTVTCFDVNLVTGLLMVCSGKMIYVVNIETNVIKAEMGKLGGSIHKGEIKDCAMDISGVLGVTCGDDKRILVWDLRQFRALKVLEGHKGSLYQVEFSPDAENVLSSSDDGRVLIWDWRTGNQLNSCMRHPAAVRTFDFNYDNPDLVLCGRVDGNVTAWNTLQSMRMDNIAPDPSWLQLDQPEVKLGSDKERYHSGAILCVKLSLDRQHLATCSADNTCKLWRITSYQKDIIQVKARMKETEAINQKINGCIDILDDFDGQSIENGIKSMKVGEVPIFAGYHADLRFTFQHEAAVLSAMFTNNSDILITGSMDATCRLWSSRRGEPLFQINLPSPVTSIKVDFNDRVYFSCVNRLLVFAVKPLFKEADLPNYWQPSEIKKVIDQMPNHELDKKDMAPELTELLKPSTGVLLSELKKLIAHGVLLPSTVTDIASQYQDINAKQLESNMKKYNLSAQHVLRLIANCRFSPHDILHALSSKTGGNALFALINQGSSITSYMIKMGYKMLSVKDDPLVTLDLKSLEPPRMSTRDRPRTQAEIDYNQWWKQFHDDESESDGDNEEQTVFVNGNAPTREFHEQKGRILHFIPSVQMKILKDLQQQRNVNPIFLRSLVSGQDEGELYPNFNVDDHIQDYRPKLTKPTQSTGVRFNETLTGKLIRNPRKDYNAVRTRYMGGNYNKPQKIVSRWNRDEEELAIGKKQAFSSSQTLFKPERYMQTRGLNVQFERPTNVKKSNGNLIETLFTMPIILGQQKSKNTTKYALPVLTEYEGHREGDIGDMEQYREDSL
ncbi:WD40-repeat-containing domain protein [Globomyces pollinis-pini]|nr:WD40-repeat-containing domain protein [Globomyces pollinis-pini]